MSSTTKVARTRNAAVRPERSRQVDARAVESLVDWMIDGARPSASAHTIIDGICRRLVAAGVPIDRFALFINTLHPNVAARRCTWTAADGVKMG